ncbi:GNAT family N-acetyltransferase [Clostridium sp. Marseille-QA1073]
MSNIIVREYKTQDWSRIEEIHDCARKIELQFAGLEDAFIPLDQAAIDEGLFDYTVVVGQLVGFVAYSKDEIAWIYVDPSAMRQGIGKSLVKHVIENTTCRPLMLEALVGNEPALRLYEAMGFEAVEILSGSMPGNESFKVSIHSMQLKTT